MVRVEDVKGLKEGNTRGFSKISLASGACRAVEDQHKPVTHASGKKWQKEVSVS